LNVKKYTIGSAFLKDTTLNNFLFDLLPVLFFFIAFKFYGIYAATWVGIISTVLQTSISRLRHKRWDKMQLVTLIVFVCFGGMTLYFHNPIFVKWKPTIVFWVFAIILLISQLFGKKSVTQRVLEGALEEQGEIPLTVGKKLNLAWTVFFLLLGSINLYIAYHFTDEVWVNFKLYGITLATLIFSLFQTVFLIKHLPKSQS